MSSDNASIWGGIADRGFMRERPQRCRLGVPAPSSGNKSVRGRRSFRKFRATILVMRWSPCDCFRSPASNRFFFPFRTNGWRWARVLFFLASLATLQVSGIREQRSDPVIRALQPYFMSGRSRVPGIICVYSCFSSYQVRGDHICAATWSIFVWCWIAVQLGFLYPPARVSETTNRRDWRHCPGVVQSGPKSLCLLTR